MITTRHAPRAEKVKCTKYISAESRTSFLPSPNEHKTKQGLGQSYVLGVYRRARNVDLYCFPWPVRLILW